MMKGSIAFFSLFLSVCCASVRICSATDAASGVDRVLARHEALVSGRMFYRIQVGKGNTLSMDNNAEFLFNDESWIIHYLETKDSQTQFPGGSGIEVTHHGKHVTFTQVPQDDGSLRYSARVRPQNPIDVWYPSPPYFAGSFWFETTVEFVRKKRDSADLTGRSMIDDHPVLVIEIPVAPEEKFDAFRSVAMTLMEGGRLRLYMAPELGYALPKVEYVTPDGDVPIRFIASDFREKAPGIFVPLLMRQETMEDDGSVRAFVEYRLSKVDLINEVIPEMEFVVDLPDGTSVIDTRPESGGVAFTVGTPVPRRIPDDLHEILQFKEAHLEELVPSRTNPLTKYLIVANVVVLAFILAVALLRKRRAL